MDAPEPLFFLHVPRTGGTSLIAYLDRQFERSAICPAHEMFEFENLLSAGKLAGHRFYRGHFGINLARKVPAQGRWITWLRRPEDRIFSTWRHMRSQPMPFDQHAENGVVRDVRNDIERARRYSFPDFCRAVMDMGRLSFFNQATVLLASGRGWEAATPAPPRVDGEVLERAKRNLQGFAFVGFTEHYVESLILLQQQMQFRPLALERLNSSPVAIFDDDRAFSYWLHEATRHDRMLFEHALAGSALVAARKARQRAIG